jgi:hypothetical protein
MWLGETWGLREEDRGHVFIRWLVFERTFGSVVLSGIAGLYRGASWGHSLLA